jgi:hypothetical protein
MAFTVSAIPTVFGNKAVRLLKVTADAAEANVSSGFQVIEWMAVGKPVSMVTGCPQVLPNANSTGTAANGTLGISGCSAGADLYIFCIGR